MPRTARGIAGGVIYHVMDRGNQHATVFRSDADYAQFLELIAEAQQRVVLEVFAACLMPNHFHLVLRGERSGDLGVWMHWLLTTHVRRRHAMEGTDGRLWQGRFKASPVADDRYLVTVLRYVERNALRAGLVGLAEDWRWGSLAWRLSGSGPVALTEPPLCLPSHWRRYVNRPQTPAELAELRQRVSSELPLGGPDLRKRKGRRPGAQPKGVP